MKKVVLSVMFSSILIVMSCDVDQTKKTKLPDVDVNVEAGQLPAFDVDWADVNVGTRTEIVEVPTVVIAMEEMEVEIPYLDVEMPDEYGEKEERTIRVEAEVEEFEHDIEIEKVYANGNNLIIVSNLEKMATSIEDKKMRVSDQIKINAPDLNVKHYIIGEKPNRVFNDSYSYVANEQDINDKVKDYKAIYTK